LGRLSDIELLARDFMGSPPEPGAQHFIAR
jgi:hypothetical protein